MLNEMPAERADQNSADELMRSYGPVRFALAMGLACAIGFLGSSAILHNYGVPSCELRLMVMLLLFPAEWAGALLILTLLEDFRRAAKERKIPSAS